MQSVSFTYCDLCVILKLSLETMYGGASDGGNSPAEHPPTHRPHFPLLCPTTHPYAPNLTSAQQFSLWVPIHLVTPHSLLLPVPSVGKWGACMSHALYSSTPSLPPQTAPTNSSHSNVSSGMPSLICRLMHTFYLLIIIILQMWVEYVDINAIKYLQS